uniref:Uncharacterized protein n=1 Tax=Trichuris muris TaxID=70415 RepID=A0A5S6QZT5_TRIMR
MQRRRHALRDGKRKACNVAPPNGGKRDRRLLALAPFKGDIFWWAKCKVQRETAATSGGQTDQLLNGNQSKRAKQNGLRLAQQYRTCFPYLLINGPASESQTLTEGTLADEAASRRRGAPNARTLGGRRRKYLHTRRPASQIFAYASVGRRAFKIRTFERADGGSVGIQVRTFVGTVAAPAGSVARLLRPEAPPFQLRSARNACPRTNGAKSFGSPSCGSLPNGNQTFAPPPPPRRRKKPLNLLKVDRQWAPRHLPTATVDRRVNGPLSTFVDAATLHPSKGKQKVRRPQRDNARPPDTRCRRKLWRAACWTTFAGGRIPQQWSFLVGPTFGPRRARARAHQSSVRQTRTISNRKDIINTWPRRTLHFTCHCRPNKQSNSRPIPLIRHCAGAISFFNETCCAPIAWRPRGADGGGTARRIPEKAASRLCGDGWANEARLRREDVPPKGAVSMVRSIQRNVSASARIEVAPISGQRPPNGSLCKDNAKVAVNGAMI